MQERHHRVAIEEDGVVFDADDYQVIDETGASELFVGAAAGCDLLILITLKDLGNFPQHAAVSMNYSHLPFAINL